MNTRGLVELVILNAGLELGVLSLTLYSMMVIMALATTLMAAPLLALLKTASIRKQRSYMLERAAAAE